LSSGVKANPALIINADVAHVAADFAGIEKSS
jgi:hypothetical protein